MILQWHLSTLIDAKIQTGAQRLYRHLHIFPLLSLFTISCSSFLLLTLKETITNKDINWPRYNYHTPHIPQLDGRHSRRQLTGKSPHKSDIKNWQYRKCTLRLYLYKIFFLNSISFFCCRDFIQKKKHKKKLIDCVTRTIPCKMITVYLQLGFIQSTKKKVALGLG